MERFKWSNGEKRDRKSNKNVLGYLIQGSKKEKRTRRKDDLSECDERRTTEEKKPHLASRIKSRPHYKKEKAWD